MAEPDAQPFLVQPFDNRDELLFKVEEANSSDIWLPLQTSKRRRYSWNHILFCLCLLLLASNAVAIFKWRLAASDACIRPKLSYSPAIGAIRYEKKTLHRDILSNPFTGEPRAELDNAWHDLLSPIVIKVSNDELGLLGEASIKIANSSDFIAELSAFHELHCIKRIRRHLNLDYYYPNMSEQDLFKESLHIDHCLEYWREAAMCRGDSSLATFYWRDGVPTTNQFSTHECVDWDNLANWADKRKIILDDYNELEPGVAFPS